MNRDNEWAKQAGCEYIRWSKVDFRALNVRPMTLVSTRTYDWVTDPLMCNRQIGISACILQGRFLPHGFAEICTKVCEIQSMLRKTRVSIRSRKSQLQWSNTGTVATAVIKRTFAAWKVRKI